MEHAHFEKEIKRLSETYGDRMYGKERQLLLFRCVQKMPNDWMTDSVNYFIASSRSAPLLKEFNEQMEDHSQRSRERYMHGNPGLPTRMNANSPLEILEKAAAISPESKDFAKFCVEAIKQKVSGKVSKEQFWKEVMPMIDQTAQVMKRPVAK